MECLQDQEILAVERMRLIDVMNWWQHGTMQTYGPYLRFLGRFDHRYGTSVLQATRLRRPPSSSSIPLMWAQLLYSLRVHKGERIKFNTIRQLRSAAASFYTWDLHHVYPGRIRRERGRDTIRDFVSPSEEATTTFATKGMARRLGTSTKPSWALSFIHIAYIDQRLREAYRTASSPEAQHEYACAGFAKFMNMVDGPLGGITRAKTWRRSTINGESPNDWRSHSHACECVLPGGRGEKRVGGREWRRRGPSGEGEQKVPRPKVVNGFDVQQQRI
jgi:hypothetical protein